MNERIYYSREAEMRARRTQIVLALGVMVIGAGIGTVIAILFAPQSGQDTRQSLVEGAESAYQGGRDTTGKVVENLRKEFDKFRSEIEERMSKA